MSTAAANANPATSGPKARIWLSIGILVVAVLIAYHNTFSVPFLLDDTVSVVENESIHQVGNWWAVLAPRSEVPTAGRPLLNLSFGLNYAAGELSVVGYHVVNLLIHLAATLTLFGLVRRTAEKSSATWNFGPTAKKPLYLATLAALFWALHPLQTNCVTYISQRAESLMALCYLLTLYCFVRATETPNHRWRVLAVVSCLAGMMVKEVMVTAPLAVLLFDRTFISSSFRHAWRQRKLFYLLLAACWLVLFALMMGTRFAARGVGFDAAYSWIDYARLESGVLLHYLYLMVWPFPLVFDYGSESPIPDAIASVRNALILGAFAGIIILSLWRRHPFGFLGAWFFILLAPTSSIVPVYNQPMAENRLYLPLATAAVPFAAGVCALGRRRAISLAGAILLGLLILTLDRNRTYATELDIWADTVARQPGSSRAHVNYAASLARAHRLDDAVGELQAALRIIPDLAAAHALLGAAYTEQQRFAEAIPHLSVAVKITPDVPTLHSNLGAALFQVGRWDEALAQFQEAIRLRPTHPASRNNAAILLARLGRPAEAIALFEETLQLYPHDETARNELGLLRTAIASGTYRPAPPLPPK